jgi:predicted ABC-type ATPase
MADSPPSVIVLAGPNGAGKTTAARTLLAETLQVMTFVNADVIAQGLAGFDPDSAAIEASRIMLERLHSLAEQRVDFAFETTLAGRTLAGWLENLRQSGYVVHLVYFWLDSPDLAVSRVAERVSMGGHNIPEGTIRQRYHRSIQNFFRLYRPIVNTWRVFDNSREETFQLVAHGDESGAESIRVTNVWQLMQKELG